MVVKLTWPNFTRGMPSNRPVLGFGLGLIGITVISLSFQIFDDDVTRAIPLLLLLVPVSVAGLLGGWKASVPLAVLTGLAYSFQFIAPVGTVQLGVTEDSASLATFVGVALFISESGRRREEHRRDREHRRAVLLRTVSHDLRNPLSAIRIASADLRDEDAMLDPESRRRLLDLVIDESARLDRIIRNLLSLSRIEAGALDPDLAPQSLSDLVADGVHRLAGPNPTAKRNIAVDVPDDLPDVLADSVQLDQVLTNLIENGLRHGGSGVRVTAVLCGDLVEVSIVDDGPGFSAEARNQAFDFFKPSGVTGAEGIGLAVCKAIVEAHGGTIDVDDAAGGGARITFTVPTSR